MRMAGVRDFRAHLTHFISGDEPVLLTRHGKVSGLYLPLEDASRVPDDIRRELAAVLGSHLSRLLDTRGVTEQEIAEDFRAHRRRRR
jgi:hypothetical protein